MTGLPALTCEADLFDAFFWDTMKGKESGGRGAADVRPSSREEGEI